MRGREPPMIQCDPRIISAMGKIVRITLATPDGKRCIEGRLAGVEKPWSITLMLDHCPDLERVVQFAGPYYAIQKIEQDGNVVYDNQAIPVPYKRVDISSKKGWNELNSLRRTLFGEDFTYRDANLGE